MQDPIDEQASGECGLVFAQCVAGGTGPGEVLLPLSCRIRPTV